MDPRREHVRRLLQVPATVATEAGDQVWRAQIIDIARLGVGFVTTEALAAGTPYVFSFTFPNSSLPCVALVDVVYSCPVGSGANVRNGARFLSISPESQEQIVDYVTTGTEAAIAAMADSRTARS
ncbi:PilZ domain-containing protein [Oxalobacteraceae bacterium]|nr:PilZ domain-containing protein [Oxalobacteraceae bacterium]